jgi:hypothetical protein
LPFAAIDVGNEPFGIETFGIIGIIGAAVAIGAGKVVGKGTVLGRSCEIRSFGPGGQQGQSKVWLWNGMPLKVEASGPQGGMTMVATRVDTSPKLTPAVFKVPSGYQVKDMQLPTGAPGAPPSSAP